MSLLNHPNPMLNEEEVAMLTHQPEECFRRAVQRGAISLDQATEDLLPRVAAAVRSIITGERVPAAPAEESPTKMSEEQIRSLEQAKGHPPTEAELEQFQEYMRMEHTLALENLVPYPHFRRLLEEQVLNWAGATAAANAIDRVLGRYLTGTKYAAP
jgi:hypothetical protein